MDKVKRGRGRGRARGGRRGTSSSRALPFCDTPGPSTSNQQPVREGNEEQAYSPGALLSEERKKLKRVRAAEEKHLNVLSAAQEQLLPTRQDKVVSAPLLPDAPPKKHKRTPSPPACPLLPGVSTTPPPREDLSMEGEDSGSDADSGSGSDDDAHVGGALHHKRIVGVCDEDLAPETETAIAALNTRDDAALRQILTSEEATNLFSFNWSSDPDVFSGEQEQFTGVSGPTFSTEGLTALAVFEKIWDSSIMELIARETNSYGSRMCQMFNTPWRDFTEGDIWAFFAIIMLQSMVIVPVEKEYWYPSLKQLKLGDFGQLMPYKRFILLKKCLHFANKKLPQVRGRDKKLHKIRPIIEHLRQKFSSLYMPEQYIAIDESLVSWKGRLSFAQFITRKASQVGIKSYELCESRTGYLWDFSIYTGKGDSQKQDVAGVVEPDGATPKIVYSLVRPLLYRGHTLVMDDFYNSPLLSRSLKIKKTDTFGTLRLNREFVPEELRTKHKGNTRPGEVFFSQTEDLALTVWRDSNIVAMISSYHKPAVRKENCGAYKDKPQVVLDYNLAMGGVDKKDQMLKAFPVERVRNYIWYKKFFRRLMNVSIHNAYIICKHNDPSLQHRQFRVSLVEQIMQKAFPVPPDVQLQMVNSGDHFPARGPTRYARCKWCASNREVSRTVWVCEGCDIPLCIEPCFKEYHKSVS